MRTAALMVVLVMLSGGCAARHGRPIVGGSVVPESTGTISGSVTSIAGTPLDGRRVTAVNVATNMRYDVMTAANGGYTIKVPTGRYRMEVELRAGDQLAKQPEALNVNLGDLDERIDFVIGR